MKATYQKRLPKLQSSQRTVVHDAKKISAKKHRKNAMKRRTNWPKTVTKSIPYLYGVKNAVKFSKELIH